MNKADINSILKENQSLKKRNQELENLLQGAPGPVPVSQEQIYRSLLHLCPASPAVTSLDDGVIYEVSDRFCRQSGFGREELIGGSTVEIGF
jgi:PAS domain-containing protein